jgi:hypothetical protein
MPTILEENPKNLESEFLKGLRNRTVIGDIQNQVVKKSKFLQYVQVLDIPGDVLKIIGLKSNRPKQFTWDYKEKEFSPGETIVHKAEITDKDKLIFFTVFSEPIEKIAVGDRVHDTIAKQTNQVSYDIADFYDEEFVQNYACDLERYHKNAIIRLNADQLQNMQLVGELAITTGYQMLYPSTLFNLKEERCNVSETKKILCFVDNSLYGRGQVASVYKSPSPVLEALERIFTVVPCNMTNNVKLSLIDSGAIYLWSSLNQRYLKLDEYVACHKLLDHIWRKWILSPHRPAFAIVHDNSVKTAPTATTLPPKKDLLTKYKDIDSSMTEDQAKEWNKFGFSYEQVKDWFDTGLKSSDAEFANWLVKTKSKVDKNYADPEWLLNNSNSDGIKSIDDLRTESKI